MKRSLDSQPGLWAGRCWARCNIDVHIAADLYAISTGQCMHAYAVSRRGAQAVLDVMATCIREDGTTCPGDLAVSRQFAPSPHLLQNGVLAGETGVKVKVFLGARRPRLSVQRNVPGTFTLKHVYVCPLGAMGDNFRELNFKSSSLAGENTQKALVNIGNQHRTHFVPECVAFPRQSNLDGLQLVQSSRATNALEYALPWAVKASRAGAGAS
eukprot:scaffold973_cov399-Prasinococcus_capsulatus_cf.AAC.14